ncbi:prepilin-type N-terminal cleavage/methylation domain-containing protein [bacterium]|nr:prepilin-type N-terminal cleavage/methylation domain-containing protein [bacterium]
MMFHRKSFGFTLVELLIGMALMVLVGGVLYLLQSTGISTVTKGTTRLTLQSEVRRKLEQLISDLRCAKEVLEITPDSIKVSKFKDTKEEETSGDESLVTVKYSLERNGPRAVFLREEGKESPTEILSVSHIEAEIFRPFYEQPPANSSEKSSFLPFDTKTNDSDQRKRISFIIVRMKLRQNKEFVSISTAITLRTVHNGMLQPHWNFR